MNNKESEKSNKENKYKYKWWWECSLPKKFSLEEHQIDTVQQWAITAFNKISLEYNIPYKYQTVYGQLKIDINEFIKLLEDAGGEHLYKKYSMTIRNNVQSHSYSIFIWPSATLSMTHYGSSIYNVEIHSVDELLLDKLTNICKDNFTYIKEDFNSCFVMQKNNNEIEFVRAGNASIKLELDNYNDHVIKDYNYIISQLNNKDNPDGRLSIFNGVPGTGKTFLIRAIMYDAKDCIFVTVPTNMVSHLMSPELVRPFLELRDSYEDKSIVLILEDADNCLLSRNGDNMNEISSLLNFGDGILGALFDIRVIATTNSESIEIDNALMRPGRLCKHITVDSLTTDKANKLFEKLTGVKGSFTNNRTLAEVYQAAKQYKR